MRMDLDGIWTVVRGDLEAAFLVSAATGIRDVQSVISSITFVSGELVVAGSRGFPGHLRKTVRASWYGEMSLSGALTKPAPLRSVSICPG